MVSLVCVVIGTCVADNPAGCPARVVHIPGFLPFPQHGHGLGRPTLAGFGFLGLADPVLQVLGLRGRKSAKGCGGPGIGGQSLLQLRSERAGPPCPSSALSQAPLARAASIFSIPAAVMAPSTISFSARIAIVCRPAAALAARNEFLAEPLVVQAAHGAVDPAETQGLLDRVVVGDARDPRVLLVIDQPDARAGGVVLGQPVAPVLPVAEVDFRQLFHRPLPYVICRTL